MFAAWWTVFAAGAYAQTLVGFATAFVLGTVSDVRDLPAAELNRANDPIRHLVCRGGVLKP